MHVSRLEASSQASLSLFTAHLRARVLWVHTAGQRQRSGEVGNHLWLVDVALGLIRMLPQLTGHCSLQSLNGAMQDE